MPSDMRVDLGNKDHIGWYAGQYIGNAISKGCSTIAKAITVAAAAYATVGIMKVAVSMDRIENTKKQQFSSSLCSRCTRPE